MTTAKDPPGGEDSKASRVFYTHHRLEVTDGYKIVRASDDQLYRVVGDAMTSEFASPQSLEISISPSQGQWHRATLFD